MWGLKTPKPASFSSVKRYESYLINLVPSLGQIRDYRSADYFIFSNAVSFKDMDPVVIARFLIDNYMMGYILNQHGVLVDITERVLGIHQGPEGYFSRTRSKQENDVNWNAKWIDEKRIVKGTLQMAKYRFGRKEKRASHE